jgi:molybdopterin-binding protein
VSIKAINARNQFKGHIKDIVFGDVLSEVDIETPSGIITAVITTRSVNELGLHVGSKALALFKATEVALAKL